MADNKSWRIYKKERETRIRDLTAAHGMRTFCELSLLIEGAWPALTFEVYAFGLLRISKLLFACGDLLRSLPI